MSLIENSMENLARFQARHYKKIAIAALLFTLFMLAGATNIYMQTDMDKEMPQDLPVFKLSDRVTATFGGQDIIMILVRLEDDSSLKSDIRDIRNPEVMQMLLDLETMLSKESDIESISSPAMVFKNSGVPRDIETSKAILSQVPQSSGLFNRDYSATAIYATIDAGSGDEKILEISDIVEGYMESVSKPQGVELTLTGTPPIRTIIFDILQKDAIYTMVLAAAVIFLLLIIMEKGVISKAVTIFVPLIFGILWTGGAMGWLDIALSVATVGMGAMILGLGVEYGVFVVSRYKEERDKGMTQEQSLTKAIPEVGSAILGSSTTTIAGFLALTASAMPMLQHLGTSLALGIFFCLVAAIVVNPAVIIIEENIEHMITHRKHKKASVKLERIRRHK